VKTQLAVILLASLAACGGPSGPATTVAAPPATMASAPPAPAPPPPAAPVPPPPPPQHGVFVDDIDKTADPCNDFYQYANGAWRAAHPIPASQSRWSRRWESGEVQKDRLRILLDEVAAKPAQPKGSVDQIVGDFYGACMDEKAVEAAGTKPLETVWTAIEMIKDRQAVAFTIGAMHDDGFDVGFGDGASQDPHKPERVLLDVVAGGLGLPERDYYVKNEKRFVEARAKYKAYMAQLFELAGHKQSPATIDAVLALETQLAKAQLDNVARREPKNLDHPMTIAQLTKLAPTFPWARYITDDLKLPADQPLNVDQPAFMTAFDHALAQTPIATWKAYLEWHYLTGMAPFLSAPIVTAQYDFDEAYLQGTKEMKPRWKRCAETTDSLFGEALGQAYVAKYFPPEAKARMRKMVDNILAATGDAVREATWMSDATKKRAFAKLATFNPKIGYPDKWKDYSHVTVTRDALFADVDAGREFVTRDDRSQIGKAVDRGRWGMTPPTSNAYYNPQLNEIVFPAGILVPPGFDVNATDAVNYGGIGVVIGHEVSHGFDDQGAQYDETGALSNWWTPEDLKQFAARGKCVSDQFDGYFIEPGIHHNGKMVLGESIGDLGGVTIAWRALQKSLASAPAPTLDGFTPEQQFFLGFAQWRGDETRIEAARLQVQNDPHPIAKFRVIGPLSNSQAFAKAFSCKAGSAMVRPDAQRCTVW
jgi:endothelin-converting enzyme/putative endopeptidase